MASSWIAIAFLAGVAAWGQNGPQYTISAVAGNSQQGYTGDGGQANQASSAAVTVPVAAAAPEFLYFIHNTNGQNPVAAVDNTTGAYIGAAGLISGATFTPAQAGEVVTVFGVGFGQTAPPQTPAIPAPAAAQVNNAAVTLGGSPISPLYVGVSPTYAGLYQVTFTVPSGTAAGPQEIEVSIGGIKSPPEAFLELGK